MINNTEDVTMTLKEDSVTLIGLTVVLNNTSDKMYLYGESMWLERKVDGE